MLKNPIHAKYPHKLSVYYPDQNINGTLGHLINFSVIVAKLNKTIFVDQRCFCAHAFCILGSTWGGGVDGWMGGGQLRSKHIG